MFVGNTINYPGGQAATVPTGIYATLSGNAGFIVRTNVNYSTDAYPDGIQGYGAGVNNSGVFGRNIDAGGIGVIGVAPVAPLRRGAEPWLRTSGRRPSPAGRRMSLSMRTSRR